MEFKYEIALLCDEILAHIVKMPDSVYFPTGIHEFLFKDKYSIEEVRYAYYVIDEYFGRYIRSGKGGGGSGDLFLSANDLTAMFVRNGGVTFWFKEKEKEQKKQHFDYLTSEWLYKTRYWPHILSAAALIISIIALIF